MCMRTTATAPDNQQGAENKMSIASILGSEAALTLAIAVAGALWSIFKGSDWLQAQRRQRLREALRALEAAVEATYREYVRALKERSPDGALTPEEQQRARDHARERAIVIARSRDIDLVRELGAEFIDLWTGRLVRKLKRA